MACSRSAITCRRHPDYGPPAERYSWPERIRSLSGLTDTLIVFAVVLTGLFKGWFTPTEAASVGAFSVLVLGLARRQSPGLGRGDRRLHGGVVVAAGIGRLGRDGQWQGQQQGRQGGHAQPPDEAVRAWGGGGGRHAVEYTQRA